MKNNRKWIIAGSLSGLIPLFSIYWIFTSDFSETPKNENNSKTNFDNHFSMGVPKDENVDPSLSREKYLEARENQKNEIKSRDEANQKKLQNERLANVNLGWNSSLLKEEKKEVQTIRTLEGKRKSSKNKSTRKRSRRISKKKSSAGGGKKAVTLPKRKRGLSIIKNSSSGSNSSLKHLAETYEGINFRGGIAVVRVRFLESFKIKNLDVSSSELYQAKIIGSSGDRLFIRLSIFSPARGAMFFSAFDADGQEGLFMEGLSVNKELQNEVASDVLDESSGQIGRAIGGSVPIVGGVVSRIVRSQKKKSTNVYLPEGKKIFFVFKPI